MQQLISRDNTREKTSIVFPVMDRVSLSQSGYGPLTPGRSSEGSEWHKMPAKGPIMDRVARDNLKWYLLNKYRAVLIDNLTREDLEELRYYHERQYDPKRGWNPEYLHKFVLKLRGYMHEEILKQEIAGIESLVMLLKPEDLPDR